MNIRVWMDQGRVKRFVDDMFCMGCLCYWFVCKYISRERCSISIFIVRLNLVPYFLHYLCIEHRLATVKLCHQYSFRDPVWAMAMVYTNMYQYFYFLNMIITWGGFVDVRLSQFHKKIISPSIMLHTLSSGLVCKNFELTSKKRGYRFDTRAIFT